MSHPQFLKNPAMQRRSRASGGRSATGGPAPALHCRVSSRHITFFKNWDALPGEDLNGLAVILYASSDATAEHGHLVQLFPGQIDIGTSEVSEGGGGLIDGTAQIERLDD